MVKGPTFHNDEPMSELPANASSDVVRAEFGRRLNRLLILKGWNQSELARQAAKLAPDGIKVNRDKVSKYIRGVALPLPAQLQVLADTLGCKPRDLLPQRGAAATGEASPRLSLQQASDGTVWLKIDQATTMETALKVLALLKAGR